MDDAKVHLIENMMKFQVDVCKFQIGGLEPSTQALLSTTRELLFVISNFVFVGLTIPANSRLLKKFVWFAG